MIKELRIGNYLHDRVDRLCRVEVLRIGEDIYAPAIIGGQTSLPNKPIELTQEWLMDFGFSIYNGWDDMEFFRRKDFNKTDFELAILSTGFEHNPYIGPIKTVHQLQNLYYALTGLELHTGGLG